MWNWANVAQQVHLYITCVIGAHLGWVGVPGGVVNGSIGRALHTCLDSLSAFCTAVVSMLQDSADLLPSCEILTE